jgi:hypothetical protein
MDDNQRLLSIDNASGLEQLIAKDALRLYSARLNKSWRLIRDKDPSEVMDDINERFDFVVIDTAHTFPAENFNFISILPYLADGAVVVCHDVSVFTASTKFHYGRMFAPRMLISTVCADILYLKYPRTQNIAAFQVTELTRQFIGGLFESLMLPWEFYSVELTAAVHKFVKKHYTEKQLHAFEKAWDFNHLHYIKENLPLLSCHLPGNAIFYGAGSNMSYGITSILHDNQAFSYKIWDKNPEITSICGFPVTRPDYQTKVDGIFMVVMIRDRDVASEAKTIFTKLGYRVFTDFSLEGFRACTDGE